MKQKPKILLKHEISSTLCIAMAICGIALCKAAAQEAGGLPSGLLTETAPADAKSVVEAKSEAKPGETVTLRGRIGGVIKPLSDGAAIAVLADEKAVTACSDMAKDDHCKTPWDYCCEDPDALRAAIATMQIRDTGGKVVRTGLRGLGGLKELSTIIVRGVVDEASEGGALIVNAQEIHVVQP